MNANFGNSRLLDRNLRNPKQGKNCHFCVKSLLFYLQPKTAGRGKLKFRHRMGADKGFTRTNFEGARSRGRNFRC